MEKWSLDKSHSEVFFKVKHMLISTVTGEFTKFNGGIEAEDDFFSQAKFTFTIDVNSINTKIEDRDKHLKSADFFDAEHYPMIQFESIGGIKEGKLTGNLIIKGVSKQIVLEVDAGGIIVDPWGNKRSGFEITGKINRKDFGLNWNQLTEAGGLVVADEVKILVNLEFIKD